MADFGETLKALRVAAGWRQMDLVVALGHQVARSTLANIETGREPPTPRVWDVIRSQLPDWEAPLDPGYHVARFELAQRAHARAGAVLLETRERTGRRLLTIEEVRYVYTFRFSHSPEEILEIRRVRAREAGVDGFDLKLSQTLHEGFRVEEECLWGGDVVDTSYQDSDGATNYLRRVDFGRRLRLGQAHVFATRSWVASDPRPETNVGAVFTLPCRRFSFQLNFWGPDRPRRIWRYGPAPDGSVLDDGPRSARGSRSPRVAPSRSPSAMRSPMRSTASAGRGDRSGATARTQRWTDRPEVRHNTACRGCCETRSVRSCVRS